MRRGSRASARCGRNIHANWPAYGEAVGIFHWGACRTGETIHENVGAAQTDSSRLSSGAPQDPRARSSTTPARPSACGDDMIQSPRQVHLGPRHHAACSRTAADIRRGAQFCADQVGLLQRQRRTLPQTPSSRKLSAAQANSDTHHGTDIARFIDSLFNACVQHTSSGKTNAPTAAGKHMPDANRLTQCFQPFKIYDASTNTRVHVALIALGTGIRVLAVMRAPSVAHPSPSNSRMRAHHGKMPGRPDARRAFRYPADGSSCSG